ncbi:MAG: biopolymer transporter ExbD [Planctomycetota bacterium]|nr:biopolymer transporter ExbD [Planctomycetota bacterium]
MPLKVHTDEAPTINLTSMIDVVFLLLIFFMVGTKFTEMENNVVLDLPRVADGANASQQSSTKTVSVFRDGAVSLDNRTMTLPELTQVMYQLRQQNPQTSVAVRSDATLTIQRVMEVATAIKKAGIQRLSFTTSQSTMSR